MRKITLYFFTLLMFSCGQKSEKIYEELQGNAQGTTFTIKYGSEETHNAADEIKKILDEVDRLFSLYIKESVIISLNRNEISSTTDSTLTEFFISAADSEMIVLIERSREIYNLTNGAFNPAVMPLIRYWGFDKDEIKPDKIDSLRIDSLRKMCSFPLLEIVKNDSGYIITKPLNMQLDFNAIAQGYTVDKVAEWFDSKNIRDYMIEIGGEVRAKGVNENGKTWSIGIDKPTEGNQEHELQTVVLLDNKSLATSGNYRKFYEKDGVKYSHAIDTETGFPARNNLLSVSVIANDCATADAYATAFMVMGLEKVKIFIGSHPEENLEVLLIYSDEQGNFQTWMSEGMKKMIREN